MYKVNDLESIEKAISDLQSGKRVASVSYGDTRVQYAAVDLQDLLDLRQRIKSGLKQPQKRQVIFSTSKGIS
jgi:precorrin-3B methylase